MQAAFLLWNLGIEDCWAGLVPSTRASGEIVHHGWLTKEGSKWFRWIMTEAAQHYARRNDRYGQYYRRIKSKHGTATAKVATARKLLRAVWGILRSREPFRGLAPSPILKQDPRQIIIAA